MWETGARVLARAVPIALGLVLLGAAAHVNIQYLGGYNSPQAIMLLAAIVALGGGAVLVGRAFAQGRWRIGVMMLVALVCGEAYVLLSTAERVISAREQQEVPRKRAAEARETGQERLRRAEAALADVRSSPRLKRALTAHEVAAAAVISESSKRTCSRRCIAALEQQAANAAAEVDAARQQRDAARAQAQREVVEARAALAALPNPRSADTLAAVMGVPGWTVDLAAAALAAISVNILGALFIAFGAHAPRPRSDLTVSPEQHAALFMADRLRWAQDTRTPVEEIGKAYRIWADGKGLQALPASVIGPQLSELFGGAGVPVTDVEGTRVAIGIALRSPELAKAA
jgi:hypothetical protein